MVTQRRRIQTGATADLTGSTALAPATVPSQALRAPSPFERNQRRRPRSAELVQAVLNLDMTQDAAYRAELSAWVDAALHGRLPEDAATAEDALRTTVVAEALVRSMNDGGRRVGVPALDDVLAGGR